MKKILIITYYYPPCIGVPGQRPQSWAENFYEHGLFPIVVTRHWNGNENEWADYHQENTAPPKVVENPRQTIIYLPYRKNKILKISNSPLSQKSRFSNIIHFTLKLFGQFQVELDAYHNFKRFLSDYLAKNSCDYLLVTSPPTNLIRLGYFLHRKFQIPLIIDFRDLWDNNELLQRKRMGTKQRISNFLYQFYIGRWIRRAALISSVTPSINEVLIKLAHIKSCVVITNGFEKKIYAQVNFTPPKNIFIISAIGTIQAMQDVDLLTDGLNLFLRNRKDEAIKIQFIGIEGMPDVYRKIKAILPSGFLFTTPRVERMKAVEYTLKSHVLLFPSYKGYNGWYATKIFDYLGARRNILMAPGEGGIVDELIRKTNAGKIADSPGEFASILESWYAVWKQAGHLPYEGREEEANKFSREHQAKLFSDAIMKLEIISP